MKRNSFTLVELMIVIAVLAILASIVLFALNPAKVFNKVKDTKRVTDIKMIHKAIGFIESWNDINSYGSSTTVYISLPDTSSTCSNLTALPILPTGYGYHCATETNYRSSTGSGWIPINFETSSGNKYLANLPIDPINDTTYFYSYFPGGSYELTALLTEPNDISINDEDSLTGSFTLGTPNRTWESPLSRDTNLVAHWRFDEGSGTTAYDYSGNGHNGTLTNDPTWITLSSGEQVLSFDGTNTHVSAGNITQLNRAKSFSVSFWWKQNILNESDYLFYSGEEGDNIFLYTSGANGGIYGAINITGENTNHYSPNYENYINSNTWSYLTMVYDGNIDNQKKIYLYSNGKEVTFYYNGGTDTPVETGENAGNSFKIGRHYSSLDGCVSNFKIYRRTLNTEEVKKIYNQEKSKYGL